MIGLALFYFVIPLSLAFGVIRLLRKYSPYVPPADVAASLAASPLQKKWFRAAQRGSEGLTTLGDFETHIEAVDRAYKGKEAALAAKQRLSFLIFNAKGEILEQVDS